MKSEIIKSKRVNNGILELIKFVDDFDKIIKYEIILGCMQKDVIGYSTGELKKIMEFEDKKEAEDFFNSQT